MKLLVTYVIRDILHMFEIMAVDGDATEKALGIREGAAAILEKIELSGLLGDDEIPEEMRETFITLICEQVLGAVGTVVK